MSANLKDEPVDPVLADLIFKLGAPKLARQALAKLYAARGMPRIQSLMAKSGRKTVCEVWALQVLPPIDCNQAAELATCKVVWQVFSGCNCCRHSGKNCGHKCWRRCGRRSSIVCSARRRSCQRR